MKIVIGKITGNTCRRCKGLLSCDKASISINGGAVCITCGFVDYSFFKKDKNTGSSEGLFYIVPYKGHFIGLTEVTVKIRVAQASMSKFQAICPFCEGGSVADWLDESDGVTKYNIRRYQCPSLHIFRVHVVTDSDNLLLGWE